MPEIILPCPKCQTHLLVDDGNAGHDVLCPGCETRLTLPSDLSGHSLPTVAAQAAAAQAAAETEDARRNFPLHRTGQMHPVNEGSPPAETAEGRHTHLPSRGRRDLDAPEELRRLASMAAAPATFDLHNVDTKGRTAFPCPACHRPVWMTAGDAGQILPCQGCGGEVIAPDPARQQPAQMAGGESADAAPRQRTVLPARRQVENLPLGEQAAAGRPRRQGGQMPQARDSTVRGPLPSPSERARTPAPSQEPIPARGDVEMAATVHKGPAASVRRAQMLTPAQESASAADEFEVNVPAAGDAAAPPGARYFQRSNPERIPNFTPKHEVDLSAETTGQWGSEGKPETSASFRRTLTTAIIVLLVGAICMAVYFFKNSFSRQDNPSAQTEENPVASVKDAKDVLLSFFAAASPADMAKYVRHPEITQPRMEAWYRDPARVRARASYTADSFTDEWQEVDNYRDSGVNFITTTLKSTDGKLSPVFLEVPKDNSGLKIDWEHFSGWSETRWEDFLRITSERSTEFRVTVTPYEYYNYAYSDNSRYLSFKVADPENSAHCYAYCEARTKLGNMLLDAVREGRQAGRIDRTSGEGIAQVIIRLRFLPEGKPHNQAVIDELVWNDWLKPRE